MGTGTETRTTTEARSATSPLAAGALAGIVGGVVIALVLVAMTVAGGGDIWTAFKGAGAPFLGERAAQPGFDLIAVLVGLASHFAVSIIWGVLFALFFAGATAAATMIAGVFWGFVVWIGMYYVVLPLVGMGEVAATTPVGSAILSHVLFGLAVAATMLPFQSRLRERELVGRARTRRRVEA